MPVEFKNVLVMVDIDRHVRRLEFRNGEQKIVRLQCPLSAQPCSVDCVAIALWEKNDSELGLACKAFKRPILIGILDTESVDLDLVEILRHGTQLNNQLKKEK